MSFHRPLRLELDYQKVIEELMRKWIKLPFATNLDDIFAALMGANTEHIGGIAERLAAGMVTAVGSVNATSWRQAARKSTQGRRIHDLMQREMSGSVGLAFQEYIATNARLIKSLPQDLAQDVASQIATRQMRGERADAIAADMVKRMPHITRAKIALLARTQVASTATGISRVRAEALNFPIYIWTTSHDSRVRPSHRNMSEVIVFWSDPPAPEALIGEHSTLGSYHAGNCPNDRCDASVIVDLDQVSWPCRVYRGGKITRMSRAKFEKLL